jgi:hypothetical protein
MAAANPSLRRSQLAARTSPLPGLCSPSRAAGCSETWAGANSAVVTVSIGWKRNLLCPPQVGLASTKWGMSNATLVAWRTAFAGCAFEVRPLKSPSRMSDGPQPISDPGLKLCALDLLTGRRTH